MLTNERLRKVSIALNDQVQNGVVEITNQLNRKALMEEEYITQVALQGIKMTVDDPPSRLPGIKGGAS